MEHDLKRIPKVKTKVMINVAIPEAAFEISFLPNSGVGLAREEFIIASKIGIHPNLILDFEKIKKRNFQFPISNFQTNSKFKNAKYLKQTIREVEKRTVGYKDKIQFYVDNLAYGIAKIGTAFYPRPVIVRFSDFKTNEYRTLLGGEAYEPKEENPMIGWRGASRYYDQGFKQAFKLECLAVKRVRDEIGLKNVIPMVPFCRTVEEGIKTVEIMAETGLVTKYIARKKKIKTKNITPIYVMCEIPSNVLLADEFLEVFDGMSIGSNDLTQLTLGLDRDSGVVNKVANENDASVKLLIAEVIKKCRAKKKYIGICGQAPSDYPEFAEFLVENGIDSISLNSDTVVKTTVVIAKKEAKIKDKRTYR
ncbi:MAG: Phosphoenolpyruvate synthase [candidate division WS2 bacterium]|nr:Phosphoenolpyruvate synthase [Candidatus Psychracetigena formicireducens]